MIDPLVSIIIPTYNRAHIICETLDSILAQTYTNWECIVVDDGSTDNTAQLMDKYIAKDNRYQYHHRPSDRLSGGNAARNYGFELSKGEYINWFDDDDIMLPNKLSIQVEELNGSKYDYAICQTMLYDAEEKKEIGLRAPLLKSENIIEDFILFNAFWLIGAPLWKRETLISNNVQFNERLRQSQDYDFHLRILEVSQNYKTNNLPLVILNIHKSNMSNSKTNNIGKIKSNIQVLNMILSRFYFHLSIDTRLKKFNELYWFYTFCLKNRYLKTALMIGFNMIGHLNKLNLNISKRLGIVYKIIVSYFSFLMFSKGEKFLKINFL